MPELAIHATTKNHLEQFKISPVHALALVGPAGIGKTTLAHQLIADLLGLAPAKLQNYPYLQQIEADGASIPIEAVRELTKFLKLKTSGPGALRRFAVIENAGKLSLEAQNALLKALEEPPADTLIILTLENEQDVLPTILSRLRAVRVHPPPKGQLQTVFAELAEPEFERVYNLSAGLPGLIRALEDEADDHPFVSAIELSKQVLRGSTFERLQLVDSLAKQKEDAANLLQALKRISDASLAQAAQKQDGRSLQRWQRVLTAAYNAETALQKGAQTKLTLTNLMLEL